MTVMVIMIADTAVRVSMAGMRSFLRMSSSFRLVQAAICNGTSSPPAN